MLRADLLEIIANGENSGIEFKRDDICPEHPGLGNNSSKLFRPDRNKQPRGITKFNDINSQPLGWLQCVVWVYGEKLSLLQKNLAGKTHGLT